MDLFLQIWAGGFYLANKVLFALSESKTAEIERKFKLVAWSCYLIGVPAWLVILIGKNNWIATSIEAGGIPAMLLGLYNVYHKNQKHNALFNHIVTICTYGSIVLGLGYSLLQHHGITSLSQILEMGVMIGFLLGSFYMAKNDKRGWLFFMLMNISMATLMFTQLKYILAAQQLLSLSFVIYGFTLASKKESV